MEPLTFVLINAGLSLFNNCRNTDQNRKLQEKQQEFARAANERNKQLMWQLMQEGQEIALEMEAEAHQNRLDDIKTDFDRILKNIAFSAAINTWPLKVLPIVMKNQALGHLTASNNENIAMHCILTPSNCKEFNKEILPLVENALSDFCNLYWSTLSKRPIIFYSGAWKTGTVPTGPEIMSLRSNLSTLPTLMITPFFHPERGLIFKLNAWGIGTNLSDSEIKCDDFSYAKRYEANMNYVGDSDLKDKTIKELIPYLECMVGYVADQYFWSAHNEAPILPSLLAMNAVNTDGMEYLKDASKKRYTDLITIGDELYKDMPFLPGKMLSIFEGSAMIWDKCIRKQNLEHIFISYASKISGESFISMSEAITTDSFTKNDKPFVAKFIKLYKYDDYKTELAELLDFLNAIDFDYSILDSTDISYLESLANNGNAAAMYRLGEIYEYSIGVKYNVEQSEKYYSMAEDYGFIISKIKANTLDKFNRHTTALITSKIIPIIVFKANTLLDQINYREARSLLNKCESNHPAYLVLVAKTHIAMGCSIDKIERPLIDAANLGYIKAQELLCELYKNKEILPENPRMHMHYAEKAMQQGSPNATYAMAMCYLKGYGIQQSRKAALLLLNKAVELNCEDAIRLKTIMDKI